MLLAASYMTVSLQLEYVNVELELDFWAQHFSY